MQKKHSATPRRLPVWMRKKRFFIPLIILLTPPFLLALLYVIVILNGIYYNLTLDRSPKPLGDSSELQYLGRETNACPQNLFMCLWAAPYARYHYGTDMKPWELAAYFKGARLSELGNKLMKWEPNEWETYDNGEAYTCTDVYLRNTTTDEPVSLQLCKHAQYFTTNYGLTPTDKPYDLIINENQYEAAKRALQ